MIAKIYTNRSVVIDEINDYDVASIKLLTEYAQRYIAEARNYKHFFCDDQLTQAQFLIKKINTMF